MDGGGMHHDAALLRLRLPFPLLSLLHLLVIPAKAGIQRLFMRSPCA